MPSPGWVTVRRYSLSDQVGPLYRDDLRANGLSRGSPHLWRCPNYLNVPGRPPPGSSFNYASDDPTPCPLYSNGSMCLLRAISLSDTSDGGLRILPDSNSRSPPARGKSLYGHGLFGEGPAGEFSWRVTCPCDANRSITSCFCRPPDWVGPWPPKIFIRGCYSPDTGHISVCFTAATDRSQPGLC